MSDEISCPIDADDIRSWREWLASFGDGPNWCDESGTCVPMAKVSLAEILDEIDRLRGVIGDARRDLLGWTATTHPVLARANLVAKLDEAVQP